MTNRYVIPYHRNLNLLKYHGLRSAAFELMDNSQIGTVEHLYGKGRNVTRHWNQRVK